MPLKFIPKDFLQQLQSFFVQTSRSIEEIEYLEFLISSMMILSLLLFLSISITAVLGSVDAFLDVVRRKVDTETLKEMAKGDSIRESFRESVRFTTDFLDGLVPPFQVEFQNVDGLTGTPRSPDVTHFLFLMHGHRGQSKDLAYMQTVMEKIAANEKRRRSNVAGAATGSGASMSPSSESTTEPERLEHDMVVHNSVCNERKTEDGIRNGGDRLVEEMRQVIENEMEKRHPGSRDISDVTISILGNSLGGLYGRYAIAKLVERHCVQDGEDTPDPCWILDGRFRLHLNVFCTTATPHLGVSKHTFLPIPRPVEMAAARVMKDTGKDLFRLNDLLHTMATCPTFLRPLATFRKRIAYANAYGTDFPVPTATAAFLSENSTYPHHFEDESLTLGVEQEKAGKRPKRRASPDSDGSAERAKKKLFVAALYTQRAQHDAHEDASDNSMTRSGDHLDAIQHKDEFHHMSECLDQLGWRKVFIDIRSELPTLEIPKGLIKKRKEPTEGESDHRGESNKCIHSLKRQRKSLSSKDLASAVAQPNDNRVSWPLGHNMIVAFSRTRMSALMNKGGRPVVDAVAKQVVEDIFAWGNESR